MTEQGGLVRRMAHRVGSLLWSWTQQRERHVQSLERIWCVSGSEQALPFQAHPENRLPGRKVSWGALERKC